MTSDRPLGLVLAGGLARRMGGGDKPLKTVGGRLILDRILARMHPQVGALALNANGETARFAAYGLPVIADSLPDYPGPLAGILAGLDWVAETHPGIAEIVSLPADCPFLPHDLVARLETARRAAGVPLAAAASGGWTHPVIGLWPVSIRAALRHALLAGERKIDRFTPTIGIAHAEWSIEPFDPFFNVNTPEDVAAADAIAAAHPAA